MRVARDPKRWSMMAHANGSQSFRALRATGRTGSIVTLMCDRADRYAATFWDAAWRRDQAIDTIPYREHLDTAWDTFTWRQ